MVKRDPSSRYKTFITHHYKTMILLILLIVVVFITIDTIALFQSDDEPSMIQGTVVFKGVQPSFPVSVSLVKDSGELIDRVSTDDHGMFIFPVPNDTIDHVSFLIWVNTTSFMGMDESGMIQLFRISDLTDGSVTIYVFNPEKPNSPNPEPDDSTEEKDVKDEDSDTTSEPPENDDKSSDPTDPDDNDNTDSSSNDGEPDESQSSSEQNNSGTDTNQNNTQNNIQNNNQTDNSQNNSSDNTSSQNDTQPPIEEPQIELSVQKTIWNEMNQSWDTTLAVEPYEIILFNVSITCNGSESLDHITVRDELPQGLIVDQIEFIKNQSSVSMFYDQENHTIHWNIANLSSNQTIDLRYTCSSETSGTHINVVEVNASIQQDHWYTAMDSAKVMVFGEVEFDTSIWDDHQDQWVSYLIIPQNETFRMKVTTVYQGGFYLENISIFNLLPNMMIFQHNATINGQPGQISYNQSTHGLFWTTSLMDHNETISIEFDVMVENISMETMITKFTAHESIGKEFLLLSEVIIETVSKDSMYCNNKVGITPSNLSDSVHGTLNDTIHVSFHMKNLQNTTVFNMTITDYLPPHMQYIDDSAQFFFHNTTFKKNPTIDIEHHLLIWNKVHVIIEDYIGPYEELQLIFQVRLISTGMIQNTLNFNYSTYNGVDTRQSFVEDTTQINITKQILPLVVNVQNPSQGFVNDTVFFQTIVSGGLPPYSYRWDFGDGTNSTEPHPYHQYNNTGTYPITLTVDDQQNTTTQIQRTISIYPEDTIAPQISVSNPGRFLYVRGVPLIRFFTPLVFGPVNITFDVNDNHSAISMIYLYIDNIHMETWDSSPVSWRWDQREYGKRVVKIIAFDTHGNSQVMEKTIWKFF